MHAIILKVLTGAGGEEPREFAETLFDKYTKIINQYTKNWTVLEEVKQRRIFIAYSKLIDLYQIFKSETGIHRRVRISPYDEQGRRCTSFTQVTVTDISEAIRNGESHEGVPIIRSYIESPVIEIIEDEKRSHQTMSEFFAETFKIQP